jgi:hypothetical protein
MEKNENFKEELENQYAILIKASEKKEFKYIIIMLIIISISLVATTVGTIFAYSAYRNSKGIQNENRENSTYYQTLAITYNTTQNLNLEGIGNGYSLATPKIINITNEGDTEVIFDVKLTNINTNLLSTNSLVYTITRSGDTSIVKELPLTEKAIITDCKIAPKETIEYVLKVDYIGQMEEGNYNSNYNSKIVIDIKNNKSNLLN